MINYVNFSAVNCESNFRGKMMSSSIDFELFIKHPQEHFDGWFNLWILRPEKRSGLDILILESRAQK